MSLHLSRTVSLAILGGTAVCISSLSGCIIVDRNDRDDSSSADCTGSDCSSCDSSDPSCTTRHRDLSADASVGSCTDTDPCVTASDADGGADATGATTNSTCTAATDCASGLCLDGHCVTGDGEWTQEVTCELQKHCGQDRACLDGRCVYRCSTTSDCGSQQSCVQGVCAPAPADNCIESIDCAVDQTCLNGRCHTLCTADSACTNPFDRCSDALHQQDDSTVRLCRADASPWPQCTFSRECSQDRHCLNAICRVACDTNADCATVAAESPICAPLGFCMTALEATAECVRDRECNISGAVCLDSACAVLQ